MEGIERPWARTDAELRDALRELESRRRSLDAEKLHLVRELDRRPPPAGCRPGTTAKHFLINALHQSPGEANRDVAAAHALGDEGPLPRMAKALAAGEVSRAHVDVAVRTVNRLPTPWRRAVAEDGEPYPVKVDAILTEQARRRRRRTWNAPAGSCWPPSTRTAPTGTTRRRTSAGSRR